MGLDIEGEWWEEPNSVEGTVKSFFENLFRYKEANLVKLPLDMFEARLEATEGEFLIRIFSEEEIKGAVWDCEGSKSPGPDIFGMDFFKHCWDIVKDDLVSFFAEFHDRGKLVRGCNSSFIVLIPKKEVCSNLNHFRPISLIGRIYKILAKVLAQRLKVVLGKLIGTAQSAFLKGRFILNGAVVVNEAIEDAKR